MSFTYVDGDASVLRIVADEEALLAKALFGELFARGLRLVTGDLTNPPYLELTVEGYKKVGIRYSYDYLQIYRRDPFEVIAEFGGSVKVAKDIEVTDSTKGLILIDRTTGTKYRLYVDNGTLNIEPVS